VFTPEKGRNAWLDLYIELVKSDIISSVRKDFSMNITREEEKAIKEILDNDSIIIRPADKGSGIVIVNSEEYEDMLLGEIKASNSYVETDEDMTKKITSQVKRLANKMYREGVISEDMRKYLIPQYARAGRLKGNPKIHKAGNSYRTIVDGKGNATENMAEVCEKELDEFVKSTPSYIQDTTDFLIKLKELPEKLPENSILFCLDVVKLYPSIPKKEGLEACKKALDTRTVSSIPTDYVMKMIETVLDGNNFNLGSKKFLQVDGVAIGSKLGKNYACCYMREWDEKAMEQKRKPLFYKRFIDDMFGVWTYGLQHLKEFVKILNEIHPNIKVELRWDFEKIEFLDTISTIREGRIITDLYRKPTDKHMYVHIKSSHPTHVKKSIPYGQAIRIKRICTKEEDYQKNKAILKRQLRKRGYNGSFIANQFSKVDSLNRENLLEYKDLKKEVDRVPLVTTYSRGLPDIHKILRKHQNVLEESEELRDVFPKPH